ncbi:MAG: hypothetical protein AAGB34_10565 [Planctomycetota bacterium]
MAVAALFALVGCTANFENENDRLRSELLTAEGRIGELEGELSELRSQFKIVSHAGEGGSLTAEEIEATPRVVGLEISRFSKIEDGVATIWIVPRDGRGRFVQMVGELTVSMIEMSDGRHRELGVKQLSASEVRDAYRSGFAGTHYFIEFPVEGVRSSGNVIAIASFVPAGLEDVILGDRTIVQEW